MTEEEARSLAASLNQRPGVVAIATQAHFYEGFLRGYSHRPKRDWIVVANGTVIRSREELAP